MSVVRVRKECVKQMVKYKSETENDKDERKDHLVEGIFKTRNTNHKLKNLIVTDCIRFLYKSENEKVLVFNNIDKLKLSMAEK